MSTSSTSPRKRVTLDAPEAFEILGISRILGYASIARGEIPALRFGVKWVVPRAKLEQLIGTPIVLADDPEDDR